MIIKKYQKKFLALSLVLCMFFPSCAGDENADIIGGADGPTSMLVTDAEKEYTYEQISQTEAKNIMDSGTPHIILDVREKDEFDSGHIPGAILIPHESIEEKAAALLPDKNALILVYCRSGRRSKIASEALAKLGYSNVKEFGGINDWEYEIIK